ncbi:MAG: pantetheine-phosphate adenylyltransferase [Clostridiales bacterium]|nr:MAG: pantetheine-phosphate adenylyltransferase [Clostridiales bacterium]
MNVAVYPGSFDPITNGHLDIIDRISKLYENVIVLVSINSSKTPIFTADERKKMIELEVSKYNNVKVETFNGLLVDYIRNKDAVIVKGLRALSDFEIEFQMALANKKLYDNAETLFLMTNMQYAHISSSLVKEINRYGGDISSMVPKSIEESLKNKIGRSGYANGC